MIYWYLWYLYNSVRYYFIREIGEMDCVSGACPGIGKGGGGSKSESLFSCFFQGGPSSEKS